MPIRCGNDIKQLCSVRMYVLENLDYLPWICVRVIVHLLVSTRSDIHYGSRVFMDCKFRNEWLKDAKFKSWVASDRICA